jgi:hypothetical protein
MPSNVPKSEMREPAPREKGDPLCEFCRPATINLPHLVLAERRLAISELRATGEWLQIKHVFEAVIKKQKARFDDAKRASIEITVLRNIVSDSAEGGLGTEQSPALMVLSNDYFKTLLAPSAFAEFLHTFDNLNGDDKDCAIINFLKDHCWIRRAVAAQWLGKDIPLPRPVPLLERPAIVGCKKWLISEMKANKEKPKPYEAYQNEAKQRFGVGPQPFRRAWREAIKVTGRASWQNPGRPKKS